MYILLFSALLFAVCNAQEEPASEETIDVCNVRNAYYKVEGSCDAYVECMDYEPFSMLCPDGLNFNPNVKWPMYPCSYPSDVPCVGRDSSQPAKPTAECPRQYGFFPSTSAGRNNCGQYRFCSGGRAFEMYCPQGLAFDVVQARCDWPDHVPGCNYEDLFGFTCPAAEYDWKGNPLISNYRYEGDCIKFYSCQSGYARLLSCDPGFAFDANLGRCVTSNLVNCEPDFSVDDIVDIVTGEDSNDVADEDAKDEEEE